jgi:hypothetical protein
LFLWQLYKTRGNRAQLSNFKKIGTFLLGATPIALACLTLFIADPELFWFNNVRYHLDRSNMSFENALKNKTQIGLVLLGLTETVKWSGISTAVLFWGGLIGSITKWRSQPLISNSLAALLIISFLPTPAYVQYFSLATPLLALSLGTLLQDSKPRHQLLLCGCLFLVALSNLNHNIKQYTVTGKGVLGVHGPRESAQSYSLRTTQKVSHIINKHFDQNDQIFSSWTGYLVETTAHPVQGTENRFGLRIAQKLKMDKAACTRHRVTTMRAVRSRLASGQIAGIILRDHYSQQNPALVKLIATLQYKEIHRGDGVRIWKLI